jgi:hypothetical protein
MWGKQEGMREVGRVVQSVGMRTDLGAGVVWSRGAALGIILGNAPGVAVRRLTSTPGSGAATTLSLSDGRAAHGVLVADKNDRASGRDWWGLRQDLQN